MGEELVQVVIYTDGACDPNPGGPGGYGVVLIYGDRCKELSGGFRSTTNKRMEIYAAIKGLETLKTACKVTLYTDSEYLVNAMTRGWVTRWKKNNWWRTRREKAANADLWERLLLLCDIHQIKFVWVRGPAGHHYNERCEKLALHAMKQNDLPTDEDYERRPADENVRVEITQEGQPCRKCSTPVIKQAGAKKSKRGRTYYYEYYLCCPKCHATYTVEEAKRYFGEQLTFPWL